jgi:hypothetical protein
MQCRKRKNRPKPVFLLQPDITWLRTGLQELLHQPGRMRQLQEQQEPLQQGIVPQEQRPEPMLQRQLPELLQSCCKQ